MIVTIVYMLLCLQFCLSEKIDCSIGKWNSIGHWETPQYALARTIFNSSDQAFSESQWLNYACPSQMLQYSCYYHEGHEAAVLPRGRAARVEQRRFTSSDPRCVQSTPLDFAILMRDRHFIWLGDSVHMQKWQSFVCAIHRTTEIKIHLDWEGSHSRRDLCPYGKSHCHLLGGILSIPILNTTFQFIRMNKPEFGSFLATIHTNRFTDNDIIVMNMGLHYNERAVYEKELSNFYEKLVEYSNSTGPNRKPPLPHLFYDEITPTHFNTESGYYSSEEKLSATTCRGRNASTETDEQYITRMRQNHWRNHVLLNKTSQYNNITHGNPVTIIPIAEGLYSQSDAHIDQTKFFWFNAPDCLHWCIPSGVFPYIYNIAFNTISQTLQGY